MDYVKEALHLHAEWKGRLDAGPKMEVNTENDLSLTYTPGVAAPCLEIEENINKSCELTGRGNLVTVVTDGTAVLGLGDIGPETGMPVMEGKRILFKEFSGVNTIPLCVKSKDMDEIVHTIAPLSGSFGGISLEDIATPRCFEIEAELKKLYDIPVFHDNQHGTAVVIVAALLNAVELTGKNMGDLCIIINDAGSAGIVIARPLLNMKFGDVILRDSKGSAYKGREDTNAGKEEVARLANKGALKGSLVDAMEGSDIFIGISTLDVVNETMVVSVNEKSVVLLMANPVPKIMPDKTKHVGTFVVGIGRSGFANRVSNVLAFPGIFRGTLDVHADGISEETRVIATYAIASLVSNGELSVDYIIPSVLNKEVGAVVAEAVAQAARESGVAHI